MSRARVYSSSISWAQPSRCRIVYPSTVVSTVACRLVILRTRKGGRSKPSKFSEAHRSSAPTVTTQPLTSPLDPRIIDVATAASRHPFPSPPRLREPVPASPASLSPHPFSPGIVSRHSPFLLRSSDISSDLIYLISTPRTPVRSPLNLYPFPFCGS